MTISSQRKMTLVAFLQAQNCSHHPASWRHPDAAQDFLRPQYYQRIARTLEQGKFHLAFFDDRLSMPDTFGGDHATAVRYGIRVVKLDLPPILALMGAVTTRLGLSGTYSTTYYEPFHVARVFATLDNLTEGRTAWNIVTSLNDSEAANFGFNRHLGHDERYDRADEFVEVVMGHWGAWAPDALAMDKARNLFADPAKVKRLDHVGPWFRSRGPFTVPPSPQGHPVLMQAGASGRGRAFAARWAELIFAHHWTLDETAKSYRALHEALTAAGRSPNSAQYAPAIHVFVNESRAKAEDDAAFMASLAVPEDTVVALAEQLNFDFARKDPHEPFSDDELDAISGVKSAVQRIVATTGNPHPTVEQFLKQSKTSTVDAFPVFTGTPADVADIMEEWFGTACDGFVLGATHVPGSYEDFVRLVVPELQRRQLFHDDYSGPTLRENLGLPPSPLLSRNVAS